MEVQLDEAIYLLSFSPSSEVRLFQISHLIVLGKIWNFQRILY